MSWILIAISAYFILAIVSLIDKYLLIGPIPSPKVYSFYIGIFGILALFLIPFVNFSVPDPRNIFLCFIYGAFFISALFWYCKGLNLFETSRIVPAIGGLIPLFVFLLTFLSGEKIFTLREGMAFLFLILGSVFITLKRERFITLKSFQISAISAFLFSLSFLLAKFIYLQQPFWSGFIWMRIGGFCMALFFLFSNDVREEVFKKRVVFKKKTAGIFISGQTLGAAFFILQNWAIFLVPFGLLAFINALEGITYIFLLIFVVFLSLKFPQILKEEVSKEVLLQKIAAILFIGAGLAILAFL